jgi:1,4-dihydroxy-2-naphthoate polyprenyltransferase
LSRAQFLPVILSPVLLGTAVAWQSYHVINWFFFALALIGAALLHLASNVINDVYDYKSGVDSISDRSFPKDFPGWKVLPRGIVSVSAARLYAYLFYAGGVLIGLYLFYQTGLTVLILGILGVLFSYTYVAPPLRVDYRGLALGEIAIFASFGPIPVLGAYYIQAKNILLAPALASIPLGLLTAVVLLSHDLIFHDVYKEGGKRSLAVVMGRSAAAKLSLILSASCYPFLLLMILIGIFPISTGAAFLGLAVLALLVQKYSKPNLQIPDYAKATTLSLIHSLAFGILLALGFLLA